jgi:mannan endo-1,4-beta-mannosidase
VLLAVASFNVGCGSSWKLRDPSGKPTAESTKAEGAEAMPTAPGPAVPLGQSVRVPLEGHDAVATARAFTRLQMTLRGLAAARHFALGHEDTTAYGVGWKDKVDHSDVKATCGTHVGVYGWDVFRIEKDAKENGDGVNFDRMRQLIQEAYARGGVITISWHSDNPVSGGDAWDTTPAVRHVLPGGKQHGVFVGYLDRMANFLQTLRGPQGELIPIVFRPFHEHTGNWFWWGKGPASEAEYVALWRFTVDYLRQQRGFSHLLYAISPSGNDVGTEGSYLYAYPGDAHVDVLGADYYFIGDSERLVHLTELAVKQAKARGKIAALTEFGPRGGVNAFMQPGETWLNEYLLKPLLESDHGMGIAYALAWRNAKTDHAHLPYPGHVGVSDLRALCDHPAVVMQRDLPPPAGAAPSDVAETPETATTKPAAAP